MRASSGRLTWEAVDRPAVRVRENRQPSCIPAAYSMPPLTRLAGSRVAARGPGERLQHAPDQLLYGQRECQVRYGNAEILLMGWTKSPKVCPCSASASHLPQPGSARQVGDCADRSCLTLAAGPLAGGPVCTYLCYHMEDQLSASSTITLVGVTMGH